MEPIDDSLVGIRSRIRKSVAIDDVLKELDTLQVLVSSADIPSNSIDNVIIEAFRSLRELTLADSQQGQEIIISYLLPHLIGSPNYSTQTQYILQEILTTWIDQYRFEPRSILRDNVLDTLSTLLRSNQQQEVCDLIWTIGYRRPDLVEALWQLVDEHDDDVGDTALATIAALGVPESDRP